MSTPGHKSNKNVVHSSKVWWPQYRRSVLVGRIAKQGAQLICQRDRKYRAEIMAWEIRPDRVHLLVEVDPPFRIHPLVHNSKGASSHAWRQERWPALWTNRYFLSAVGAAPGTVLQL